MCSMIGSQAKFGARLKPINDGVEKDGAFYLFTLRMIPIFPFFVINLVMGLTRIRTWTYYWVSQIGMLLATASYSSTRERRSARSRALRGCFHRC